jgi:hypothetical protein
MASPPGTKGDQAGILAVADVLGGLAGALLHRATAQGAGIAEDAAVGELRLDKVKYKYSRTNEVIIN